MPSKEGKTKLFNQPSMCNNEALLAKMVGLENLIKEKFKTNDASHDAITKIVDKHATGIKKNADQILLWKGISIGVGFIITGIGGFWGLAQLVTTVQAII